VARADGDGEGDDGGRADEDKKKVKRVYRYTSVDPDSSSSLPMFVICLEELYNRALTECTMIRIWKLVRPPPGTRSPRRWTHARRPSQVFDPQHSDTELWRKLMDENRATRMSAGIAHNSNGSRRKNLVEEQRHNRAMAGGRNSNQLEYFAGTQYSRLASETEVMEALKCCAGKSMHSDGLPTCDWSALPPGVCTTRISGRSGLGGTHPLSPEYQFNAKRRQALAAWQLDFDGDAVDVHPHFNDPSRYFSDDGVFSIPTVSKEMGGFFFCIDPSQVNIFDLSLPRPIYGSVAAGPHVLSLYKEQFIDDGQAGSSHASVSDRFTNFMTQKDLEHLEMERQANEAVTTFDAIGLSDAERRELRHYGEYDNANAYIMEPRQHLKDLQVQARRVIADLIQPWLMQRKKLGSEIYEQCRDDAIAADPLADLSYDGDAMAAYREHEDETQRRHSAVMRDLVHLHLSRLQAAFESRLERETIPQGYCAVYDYLKSATAKMLNGTASVAWNFDSNLVGADTTVFAQQFLFIGTFFEHDCFSSVKLTLTVLSMSPILPDPCHVCAQSRAATVASWRMHNTRTS
jgi:hypothetical protein